MIFKVKIKADKCHLGIYCDDGKELCEYFRDFFPIQGDDGSSWVGCGLNSRKASEGNK